MTDVTLTTPYLHRRSQDVRIALMLTYITLGWMTIEGAASLLLGWASKSLLLEAFGDPRFQKLAAPEAPKDAASPSK